MSIQFKSIYFEYTNNTIGQSIFHLRDMDDCYHVELGRGLHNCDRRIGAFTEVLNESLFEVKNGVIYYNGKEVLFRFNNMYITREELKAALLAKLESNLLGDLI